MCSRERCGLCDTDRMRHQPERTQRMLCLERDDVHPVWTWLAVTGLVIAVALALFGLPPVDLHGPLHRLGIMDPLCGATRSWYLITQGQLREAIRYNPAAPILLVATVVACARAAVGWATGRWVTVRVSRRISLPHMVVLVIAVAALEINQQLHAELLMAPWQR